MNSTRMYTGPGADPLIAAAVGWDDLAGQLQATASSYRAVIAELSLDWRGPSATQMTSAVAPFVAWLTDTAGQAEQTAAQLRVAISAYETAFLATVPPPAVFANRTLLMSLIATNLLGQNTAAIAATESQYAAMWAQDAAAMYGYAGSSTAASQLTPFTAPKRTTAPSDSAGPAAALDPGATIAAANTTPSATTASPDLTQFLVGPFNPLKLYEPFGGNFDFGIQNVLAELGRQNLQLAYDGAVNRAAAGLGPAVTYSGGQPVLAGFGQAATAGRLSVPPNWASAAPEITPVAYVVPRADVATVLAGEGPSSMLSNLGTSAMAGRAIGGADSTVARAVANGGPVPAEATTATIIVIPDDD